jgi:hypothetical protein
LVSRLSSQYATGCIILFTWASENWGYFGRKVVAIGPLLYPSEHDKGLAILKKVANVIGRENGCSPLLEGAVAGRNHVSATPPSIMSNEAWATI